MAIEGIQDGDFVYAPNMKGVYYRGGVVLDFEGEEDELEEEWRSDTLAGSCIIKCRKISGTTYFTKGKLNDLGYFLKENPAINVVFVNATLTTMQQKKLAKRLNDIIQGRDDRVRRYMLKTVTKAHEYSPTEIDSETEADIQMTEEIKELGGDMQRKIRVVDRFGLILQIFASRAKTRTA